MVPNIAKQIFGSKVTPLFGIMFTYTGVTGISIMALEKLFLTERTYEAFFLVGAGFSLVSLVLLICCFQDTKFPARPQDKDGRLKTLNQNEMILRPLDKKNKSFLPARDIHVQPNQVLPRKLHIPSSLVRIFVQHKRQQLPEKFGAKQ